METNFQGRKFALPPSDPTLVMQVMAVPVQDPFWGLKLEPQTSVISCADGSDENNSEVSRALVEGQPQSLDRQCSFSVPCWATYWIPSKTWNEVLYSQSYYRSAARL